MHCAKADEALALTANRADLYLKPRAIYMQAALVGMRGEWDEMERLLDKASATAPGAGTVQNLVDKARRGLARARAREAPKSNSGEAEAVP